MRISQRGSTAALVAVGGEVDAITINETTGAVTLAAAPSVTGNVTVTSGDLIVATAGKGLNIKSGANSKIGTTAAMVAGVIATSTTAITANSIVLFSRKTTGGTTGDVSYTIVAGTSFTLTSTSNTETSTFDYMIVEKG